MGGKTKLDMVSRGKVRKTRINTRFGSNLMRWDGFWVDWRFQKNREFLVMLVWLRLEKKCDFSPRKPWVFCVFRCVLMWIFQFMRCGTLKIQQLAMLYTTSPEAHTLKSKPGIFGRDVFSKKLIFSLYNLSFWRLWMHYDSFYVRFP